MSGHSKWSKVKHQKATTDVVKGAAFTKAARAITIAVVEGGRIGDPNRNFHLRLAIEKAREVNVPKENIQRAIEKGMGVGAAAIEQIQYEGYGPHGVAVLVDAATDNNVRTVAQLKNVFDKAGGSIASPGSVAYQFRRTGIITVLRQPHSFDALFEAALEAGADEVVETSDVYEIYAPVAALSAIRTGLEQKGIGIDNTSIIMKPVSPVSHEPAVVTVIDAFVDSLASLDDVQMVYTNVNTDTV